MLSNKYFSGFHKELELLIKINTNKCYCKIRLLYKAQRGSKYVIFLKVDGKAEHRCKK